MNGRTAGFRVRKAAAAVCVPAALLACAFLFAAHWLPNPFSAAAVVSARYVGHGARAAVSWPCGDVDANAATEEELQALSGVGPVLAQAIVAEREANGAFDYPEDLTMVKGVGAKTLAGFYDQLNFSSRAGAF
jgi:competence protein ComEA